VTSSIAVSRFAASPCRRAYQTTPTPSAWPATLTSGDEQRVGAEQQRVAQVAERLGVVPGPLRCDPQAALAGVVDGRGDVRVRAGHRDGGGLLRDGQVERADRGG